MRFQLESNIAHDIIILNVFIVLLHAGISEQEKKTFSYFVLDMMPVALAVILSSNTS